MRGTEVVEQLLIGRGLFQRVKLLAVQVLHQRVAEHGIVVSLADDGRDHGKARSLRRSPAALAHDEFILSVAKVTNDDRLKEAYLGDGESEFVECVFVEGPSGLTRVRGDRADCHLLEVGSGYRPQGWLEGRLGEGGRWRVGGNCAEGTGGAHGCSGRAVCAGTPAD